MLEKLKKKGYKKVVVICIAFFVIVSLAIKFFSTSNTTEIIASVDEVKPDTLQVVLKQTGVIKPQVGAMISIGARATGTIESVGVKVGDNVTKGQLVAKIDSRSIRQTIAQAEDNLKKAESDLRKQIDIYPIEEAMQKNTIESAESNYSYLKDVYERELELYNKGYSRKETLDKAKHEMITSKTNYERAILQLDYNKKEYETNVEALKSEVRRQKSILEDSKISLSYTEIYSPIDGVVSSVKSVEGETVVAGLEVANLITVFRPELLEMHIYIDESDVGKVTSGMDVIYTVDTYMNRTFKGKISRVNLQSEIKDNVVYYLAIVGISTEDAVYLRPDMTVNVQIVTQIKDVAMSVSSSAIKWDSGSQFVYKVINKDKNITEKRAVKTGIRGEKSIEILEGLNPGDQVVVSFKQAE